MLLGIELTGEISLQLIRRQLIRIQEIYLGKTNIYLVKEFEPR